MFFARLSSWMLIASMVGFINVGVCSDIAQDCPKERYRHNRFYLELGSGASFASKTHVNAPSAFWDPAIQGYNSTLGTRPIIEGGLGYEIFRFLSTDITFSYRPNFKYRKFQNSPANATTPGFLGTSKTRKFDLDVASSLLSVYLSGRGTKYLCWKLHSGAIYPVIGGGVGVSRLDVFNFRTTGLPPVNPAANPFPAFASENENTVRYRLSYQISGSLEYRHRNCWALSAGYRWFNAGHYKGPSYVRTSTGTALDLHGNEWRMNFAAQEAIVQFKLFL